MDAEDMEKRAEEHKVSSDPALQSWIDDRRAARTSREIERAERGFTARLRSLLARAAAPVVAVPVPMKREPSPHHVAPSRRPPPMATVTWVGHREEA